MSVLFETSLGDLVFDLEIDLCPKLSSNFLKLCKIYYYNFNIFFNLQKDFLIQSGDPTSSGLTSQSIFSLLPSSSPSHSQSPHFAPELHPTKLLHQSFGTLSMACTSTGCGSQFFITLCDAETSEEARDSLKVLDGVHAPFGRLVEGEETLKKMNEVLVGMDNRPLRDIMIRHVVVLDDPFPDPEGLVVPPASPTPTPAILKSLRVSENEDLDALSPEELEKQKRDLEASSRALTLEMVGDLPFAEVAPPENVLFVCKLNRVTRSEDLELIFSRFGKVLSCEVIKDSKTGDSLQYAFVEFEERESAEMAYGKMEGVLIDDRRIHVDFSQSVTQLHSSWLSSKASKFGGRIRQRPSKGNGGSRGYVSKPRRESPAGRKDRERERKRSRSPKRDEWRRDERRDRDRARDDRRDRGRDDRDRDRRDDRRDRDRDRRR